MVIKSLFLCIFAPFLYATLVATSSVRVDAGCQQERMEIAQLKKSIDSHHTTALLKLQTFFDEEQHCSPCAKCIDKELKAKLEETQAKLALTEVKLLEMERKFKEMAAGKFKVHFNNQVRYITPRSPVWFLAVNSLANGENGPAHVPRSIVESKKKSLVTLTCKSHGARLSACVWGRHANTQRDATVVAMRLGRTGEQTNTYQTSTFEEEEPQNGSCSLRIGPMTKEDFGMWSCTLVDQAGAVLTGQVTVNQEGNYNFLQNSNTYRTG